MCVWRGCIQVGMWGRCGDGVEVGWGNCVCVPVSLIMGAYRNLGKRLFRSMGTCPWLYKEIVENGSPSPSEHELTINIQGGMVSALKGLNVRAEIKVMLEKIIRIINT